MRLRPYIHEIDFDTLKAWVQDERSHALWSANRFPYPLESCSFAAVLAELAAKKRDCPFTAEDDSGRMIGFFCYSLAPDSQEGMLKFVAVDSTLRGQGYGTQMICLALRYAFEISKAQSVRLNVFSVNEAARHCYLRAGFTLQSVTEQAFRFRDEMWDRCHMAIGREEAQCVN